MFRTIKSLSLLAIFALVMTKVAFGQCEGCLPACEDHDPLAYHPLIDAELGCHYDHEHGFDPTELDWIFGKPKVEAHSNVMAESHSTYLWFTSGDDLLEPQFTNGTSYIAAFRQLKHFNTNPLATSKRYHSAYGQYLVCQLPEVGEQCGVITFEGVDDFGSVLLIRAELAGYDFPRPIIVTEGGEGTFRPARLVHPVDVPSSGSQTWYNRAPRLNKAFELRTPLITGDGRASWVLLDPGQVTCDAKNCYTPAENVLLVDVDGDESRNTWHFVQLTFGPQYQNGVYGFDPISRVETGCTEAGPDCALLTLDLPFDPGVGTLNVYPGDYYPLVDKNTSPEGCEWLER